MIVKLLTEHHLEFLILKGGCRGSSESTLVKMPHCWKSHDTAHICLRVYHLLRTCATKYFPHCNLFNTLYTVWCVHGLSIYEIKKICYHAEFLNHIDVFSIF